MKAILAALIVAVLLDSANGAARAGAEEFQVARPPIRLREVDDRGLYRAPPSCLPDGRRSARIHLFRCQAEQRCLLPAAQPLHKLLHGFKSARIVKIGPQSDGCMRITVAGEFKLPDAPPWAGTFYSGWRPYRILP